MSGTPEANFYTVTLITKLATLSPVTFEALIKYVAEPAAEGVPDISPVLVFKLKPAGRVETSV
jgi:hypothetical protein